MFTFGQIAMVELRARFGRGLRLLLRGRCANPAARAEEVLMLVAEQIQDRALSAAELHGVILSLARQAGCSSRQSEPPPVEHVNIMHEVLEAIEPQEREMLMRLYVHGVPAAVVCQEFGIGRDRLVRTSRAAKQQFQRLIVEGVKRIV